jgi:hypothetical protein
VTGGTDVYFLSAGDDSESPPPPNRSDILRAMGLSVCVGYLADMLANDEEGAEWFREQLATINAALASRRLPSAELVEVAPALGIQRS